jgi:hypothetical protein
MMMIKLVKGNFSLLQILITGEQTVNAPSIVGPESIIESQCNA